MSWWLIILCIAGGIVIGLILAYLWMVAIFSEMWW